MMKNSLIDLAAKIVHETDKAYLFDFGDKKAWVPKSVVEVEKVRDGTVVVTMPASWAEEKGLA